MLLWISLLVVVVCSIAGLAFATVRGIKLYRAAKRTLGAVGPEMERLERTLAEMEENTQLAAEARERLAAARTRLERSRAQLSIQLAALREARESFGWLSLIFK